MHILEFTRPFRSVCEKIGARWESSVFIDNIYYGLLIGITEKEVVGNIEHIKKFGVDEYKKDYESWLCGIGYKVSTMNEALLEREYEYKEESYKKKYPQLFI